MEHIIRFKTTSWYETNQKISEYSCKDGFFLNDIKITNSFIYSGDGLEAVSQEFEIEMIKHEKEKI